MNNSTSDDSDLQKLLPLPAHQSYGSHGKIGNGTATTTTSDKPETDVNCNPPLAPNEQTNSNSSYQYSEHAYISYRKRWYILGVFFISTCSQLTLWNTFGPIANTAQAVYGFSDNDIALLAAWGAFTQALSGPVFAWFMDVKGLRISMLISNGLLFLGTAIRCIPLSLSNTKWAMHIGHIMIGCAGPVVTSGAPLLSATWFPVHQTTTSTAIGTSAYDLGVAFSFLIGPAIVSDVQRAGNETRNGSLSPTLNSNRGINSSDISHYREEINNLMYIECAWTAALLVLVLVYFPAKPPTPPRPSAEITRAPFIPGAQKLLRSSQFWFVALAYGLSNGVSLGWSSQTILIFEEADDVEQSVSSRIGFYTSIAGVIGAILFGWLVDHIHNKMKLTLLILTMCSLGSSLWILLLCDKIISFHIESLYISNILFGFFVNSNIPIYFEMTVKGTFPVAEGITTTCLIIMNSICCSVILIIMLFPNISIISLNYAVFSCLAVSIPLLILYQEKDNRDKEEVQ